MFAWLLCYTSHIFTIEKRTQLCFIHKRARFNEWCIAPPFFRRPEPVWRILDDAGRSKNRRRKLPRRNQAWPNDPEKNKWNVVVGPSKRPIWWMNERKLESNIFYYQFSFMEKKVKKNFLLARRPGGPIKISTGEPINGVTGSWKKISRALKIFPS